MSDKSFRSIDVSLKGTGYTYIVRVLSENDSELIGCPVENENIRVRAEKDAGVVYFLEDNEMDSLDDLRSANLISIRHSVPDRIDT